MLHQDEIDRFSFLLPFGSSLWYSLGLSIVAVGFYLTIISRISPYGAHGRFFQSEEAEDLSIKQEIRRKKSSVANFLAMKSSRDVSVNIFIN